MKTLAERHADRIKRKAENTLESRDPVRGGNPIDGVEESGFVEGGNADGFTRAGVGVVNPNFVLTADPASVNDVKGVVDPITGSDAANATNEAQAEAERQAAWPTTGGSEGTSAQSGNGGGTAASGAEGATSTASASRKGSK